MVMSAWDWLVLPSGRVIHMIHVARVETEVKGLFPPAPGGILLVFSDGLVVEYTGADADMIRAWLPEMPASVQ